jgi:hypothetical protein
MRFVDFKKTCNLKSRPLSVFKIYATAHTGNMKNTFILSTVLFVSLAAKAGDFTNDKCSEILTGSGAIQVNRQFNADTGECFLDLHPRNSVGLKYRDYFFNHQGHFMVFNSYGWGPDATMTAARDFFLFPVTEDYPDFRIEDNGDVTVKMVSGHLLRVSAQDFSVVSFTPGTFSEKPLADDNYGGLEIGLGQGYWIDGGFKKGGNRMSNPKLKSLVKSAQSPGKSCEVLNDDLLKYTSEGDFYMRYEKEDLTNFLVKKCSGLKF